MQRDTPRSNEQTTEAEGGDEIGVFMLYAAYMYTYSLHMYIYVLLDTVSQWVNET